MVPVRTTAHHQGDYHNAHFEFTTTLHSTWLAPIVILIHFYLCILSTASLPTFLSNSICESKTLSSKIVRTLSVHFILNSPLYFFPVFSVSFFSLFCTFSLNQATVDVRLHVDDMKCWILNNCHPICVSATSQMLCDRKKTDNTKNEPL